MALLLSCVSFQAAFALDENQGFDNLFSFGILLCLVSGAN
jgi:hypothetical protein